MVKLRKKIPFTFKLIAIDIVVGLFFYLDLTDVILYVKQQSYCVTLQSNFPDYCSRSIFYQNLALYSEAALLLLLTGVLVLYGIKWWRGTLIKGDMK